MLEIESVLKTIAWLVSGGNGGQLFEGVLDSPARRSGRRRFARRDAVRMIGASLSKRRGAALPAAVKYSRVFQRYPNFENHQNESSVTRATLSAGLET